MLAKVFGTSAQARANGAWRLVDFAINAVLIVLCAVFIAWPVVTFLLQPALGTNAAATALSFLGSHAQLLAQSAAVGAATSVVSTAVALAVALLIVFGPRLASRAAGALVAVSLISPPFVASLAYIELFGRRGLITHGLMHLSVSPYGWQGIVSMQALFFAALNVMLIVSVLQRADKNALLAAYDLGASTRRVFWDVLFPLLQPALGVCLLLTFVRSISDYATPVVIGGKFDTIATEIYVRLVGYSDLSTAALLNLLLFICSLVAFAVLTRYERTTNAMSATVGSNIRAQQGEAGFRLNGSVGFCTALVAGVFLLFLLLLYLTILVAAFSKGMGWSGRFTLENFSHLLSFNLDTLTRSVVFALCCAGVSTALGFLAAVYVVRRKLAGHALLDFVTTVPYTLPGLCLGLGYILAFNHPPLELVGTNLILVAVLAAKELAVSFRAFTAAFAQVPANLDAAARDLGASWPQLMAQVLLPSVRQAVAVSLVNGFSSAMVSYSAVLFLVAPGNKTAIFELFDALSGGKYGQAAAIAVVLIGITSVVNLVLYWVVIARRRR